MKAVGKGPTTRKSVSLDDEQAKYLKRKAKQLKRSEAYVMRMALDCFREGD